MSLANGRHYLAIPGPSVMPDRVLQAMHQASPNIYTGPLVEMAKGLIPDLRTVADTTKNVAIYIANGHGAWEAALTNTLSRGDRILVLGTGRFCLGWGEMAARLGADVQIIDFGLESDIDMARVTAALAEDKDHQIKAVLAVHVDTSSSVKNDIHGLRKTLDAADHPAMLFSDNIACLGCDEFHMDDWGVDVMVTGSQKGLMTPPGLSFVYFSEKADRARETANMVTPYWDWRPRVSEKEFYMYFCGTAPTHHLFGLREALNMIVHEEGMAHVWARHATLARSIWAAVDAWGLDGPARMNIADPTKRSHAVSSVTLGGTYGTQLRSWVTSEAGLTLGIPLGRPAEDAEGYFRIGHMGHVNAPMILGLLATLEAGMKALGVPHGKGGLDAAATVIAGG
jgi:alanine-glyoxylate transaminase/serine-glyoxylate transaminase/serine-pyruvate transaminase